MRQSVVKRLRREVNKDNTNPYVSGKFHPGNPDIAAHIKAVGLEKVIQARGYAPLTYIMDKNCKRAQLKAKKREYYESRTN